MKSGYLTTEFWITLVAQILPFLVLFKLVPATDAQSLQDTVGQAITAVGAFAAAGAVLWKYIQSRNEQKIALVNAESDKQVSAINLEVARIENPPSKK